MSKSKQLSLFASLSVAMALGPVATGHVDAASENAGRRSNARLAIGLVCNGTTSSVNRVMRGWDSRFSGGRLDEQCLDRSAVVSISPVKSTVEVNPFSKASVVVVEMTADDGRAVERLFSDAIRTSGGDAMRQDVILLDGKVIVSAYVAGPFQGRTFQIDPASADAARLIVKELAGDAR